MRQYDFELLDDLNVDSRIVTQVLFFLRPTRVTFIKKPPKAGFSYLNGPMNFFRLFILIHKWHSFVIELPLHDKFVKIHDGIHHQRRRGKFGGRQFLVKFRFTRLEQFLRGGFILRE